MVATLSVLRLGFSVRARARATSIGSHGLGVLPARSAADRHWRRQQRPVAELVGLVEHGSAATKGTPASAYVPTAVFSTSTATSRGLMLPNPRATSLAGISSASRCGVVEATGTRRGQAAPRPT